MTDESNGERSIWRGIRAMLFGDEGEATLREEIEEAIESHEGAAPIVGDLSPIERQMLRNLLHFGESTVADIAVPRGDIIAVPEDQRAQAAPYAAALAATVAVSAAGAFGHGSSQSSRTG